MVATTYSYQPDYAVPPGWVLEEHLESHGLSPAELARRCGRPAKLISEIIAGEAPVEPETALKFERVLGLDASIWLGIEARYQLQQAVRPRRDRHFGIAGANTRNRRMGKLTIISKRDGS
ncbi:MAG: HigA family addiction module antitoxin [Acidobacteriota bacterium]|nr:HigA family addiction module antitoxin [Acidobacteriota bacterium]MDE2963964.1 HigA family addiction module antitoxin [Acidobacteriota bacterium]